MTHHTTENTGDKHWLPARENVDIYTVRLRLGFILRFATNPCEYVYIVNQANIVKQWFQKPREKVFGHYVGLWIGYFFHAENLSILTLLLLKLEYSRITRSLPWLVLTSTGVGVTKPIFRLFSILLKLMSGIAYHIFNYRCRCIAAAKLDSTLPLVICKHDIGNKDLTDLRLQREIFQRIAPFLSAEKMWKI